MRTPSLLILWVFLAGLTAGSAQAAPPSRFITPLSDRAQGANAFAFRVDTPALLLSRTPGGTTQVRLEGFPGRSGRPGDPDLPFAMVRVALPPGATPVLDVRVLGEDAMRGIVPEAAPRFSARLKAGARVHGATVPGDEVERSEERVPDPTIYGGSAPYPAAVARLGRIGTFRDQRYVEVLLDPVRYDPLAKGLRVARSFEVTVRFSGGEAPSGSFTPDPRLEDLYRTMFLNYAQSTSFRASATTASASPSLAAPASGPLYRIRVRANGVVRLTSTLLAGTGLDTMPLSQYKLTNRGVETPLLVHDANANDQLDAGDWVEFYGQALDDEPKTVLNTLIPGGSNIYEARDYTDENVYFLTAETGSRARLTEQSAPANNSAPATKWDAVAHDETDNAFRPLGGADPWYWSPSQSSGGTATRTESVALPGLASGTDPAEVLVRLRGLTEDAATFPDHRSKITFSNASSQTLATNNDDGTWDGRTIYTHDFTWTYPGSGATLTSPAQVRIDALSVSGSTGYTNQFILDFIEIHYKRTFQASGDVLTFDWPDGDQELQVTGLASSAPEIWEITGRVTGTDVIAPVRVTSATIGGGAGNFSARFHMTNDPSIPDGTPRRFVVFGDGAVSVPAAADFTADTVSDLKNNANQADLIVITEPTSFGAASSATLSSLLSWKSANLGITSKVVALQDVDDEFDDGLAGPQAIKNFLAWVMSTSPGEGWADPKPAWVLLIGDGSFDYKHLDTSQPVSNLMPTQILFKDDPSFGYYASDSMLADVVGNDTIPDLTVGRISTRSDADTNVVLQKMLDYAQSPPAGAWQHHAILVSDRGKNYSANEAAEWEQTNQEAVDTMQIPPYDQRTMRYWTDYCGGVQSGCTPVQANNLRNDIKSAVNGTDGANGGVILQFTGHGNFNVWSDDAFFAEGWSGIFDVSSLVNGTRLPWLIAHNCLTGGFEDNVDVTLGEDWLKKSGGGAIAVYAPSGLSTGYVGFDVTPTLWSTMFGNTKERMLGIAVANTVDFLCGYGYYDACQNYALLGDPTTRLDMPTIAPPTNPAASGGNAAVSVTWTASTAAGAVYDVYRATGSPTAAYAKVNGAHVTGTSFNDTGVVNAKTYYYYVVALDASGFESRWSNFNSDCGTTNLDCVTATPLNPNPPAAPTGLTVTDPETGGKLNLSWTANAETDLDHYTVWWGTASGTYTSSANAGKATTYTLAGLQNQTTYYIAITATNTSSKTSGYSGEQSGTPTLVQGLQSPEFIATLHVDKSGTDAQLSWAAVTTDIYHKPTTISYYEVYRGTTPNFIPSAGNRIAQPTAASFKDPGALSTANPNYYYLVRAVDTSGNGGGLGNQLPDGTDFVTLAKGTDGMGNLQLTLTWPAVTQDFDHKAPVTIDHYEVYGTDHTFTRADVKNGLVPLLASPVAPSWVVTPPAASQYYSVIAVDARGNKSPY